MEEVEAVSCQGPEGQEGCQERPGILDRPCFHCLAGSHAQAAPSEGTCKEECLQTFAEVGPHASGRVTSLGDSHTPGRGKVSVSRCLMHHYTCLSTLPAALRPWGLDCPWGLPHLRASLLACQVFIVDSVHMHGTYADMYRLASARQRADSNGPANLRICAAQHSAAQHSAAQQSFTAFFNTNMWSCLIILSTVRQYLTGHGCTEQDCVLKASVRTLLYPMESCCHRPSKPQCI